MASLVDLNVLSAQEDPGRKDPGRKNKSCSEEILTGEARAAMKAAGGGDAQGRMQRAMQGRTHTSVSLKAKLG